MTDAATSPPRPSWTHLVGSTGFISIILILLILTVQYVGSWYGLEIAKISMEQELERYLIDQARASEPTLRAAALEVVALNRALPPATDASAAAEDDEVAQADPRERLAFKEFAEAARLKNLTLLDEEGRVLLSSADAELEGQHFDFVDLDREPFELALAGAPAGSLAYKAENSPLKRVYFPVRGDAEQAVAGVLCLTAGRDYLVAIDRLADSLRFISTVATVCVLLVAWLVYRLIVRQRRYEMQAAHDDRLRSLGTLAAGFAHEVRNPLEIILACTEDLERTLNAGADPPAGSVDACRDILEEVDRLNRLVGQFLQYARADSPEGAPGATPIAECVRSCVALVRHAADKRRVAIDFDPASISPEAQVAIDPGRLRQIALNLLMNAIQASPEGGRIGLRIESDARAVRLRVTDAGPGVARHLRSRIFDPFFTTREDGSGLGLAIAHRLAEMAGGRIEYVESAGPGACFALMLPRGADLGADARSDARAVEAILGA